MKKRICKACNADKIPNKFLSVLPNALHNNTLFYFIIILASAALFGGVYAIASSASLDPTFNMTTCIEGVGCATRAITTDLNLGATFTANSSGVAVTSGSSVCLGVITVNASNFGNYTNVRDTKVECPAYLCGNLDNTTASTSPPLLSFVDSSTFTSTLSSVYATSCLYSDTAPAIHALEPNVVYANYYRGDTLSEFIKNAATRNGVFCYGTSAVKLDSTTLSSSALASSSLIDANIQTTGQHNITVVSTTTNCAMMVRTYKTTGATYECVLQSPSAVASTGTSAPISVNVYRGPVMNVSNANFSPSPAPIGALITFSFTLTNAGDTGANIQAITVGNLTGVAFTSPAAFPATLAAGASMIVNGTGTAPATAGDYTLSANVQSNSTMSLIGTCDNLQWSGSLGLGTITINQCPSVTADITINPDQTRDGDRINFTLRVYNVGRDVMISSTDVTFQNLQNAVIESPSFPVNLTGAVVFRGYGYAPAPGNYNLVARITYPSVGSCISGLANATIPLRVIGPLRLEVVVWPTGIIKARYDNVSINISVYRDGQEVERTIRNANISMMRWNGTAWVGALAWYPKEDVYFTYPDGQHGNSNHWYRVYDQYSGDDWQAGVYRVNATVYDIPRVESVSLIRYFTIYNLACTDR